MSLVANDPLIDAAYRIRPAEMMYYSPTPTLTLNAQDQIVDFNIALECLLADDISTHRDRELDEFLTNISPRVTDGQLLPSAKRPRHVAFIERKASAMCR